MNNKKKPLKVLWLPSWYPSKSQPLLGNFTQREANAVAPFCQLAVLYVSETEDAPQAIANATKENGLVEVIVYIKPSRWKLLKALNYMMANIKGYNYIVGNYFKPELMHLHTIWYACIPAIYFHLRYKLPFLAREHWGGYKDDFRQIPLMQLLFAKLVSKLALSLSVVSNSNRSAMLRHGIIGNYKVIPNVVSVDDCPIAKRNKSGRGRFRFVHVSDFDDSLKNIRGMMRAAKELSRKRQDFTLIMVGGIDGLEEYKQYSEELGLDDYIEFRGILPHAQTLEVMSGCDSLLLFSNREGLSCVLLEGMAVGLPIVSSHIEDYEEWVTKEVGYLVPIADEVALVEAMSKMIDNGELFDFKRIRKLVQERCDAPVIGRMIFEEYLNIQK